MRTQSRGRWWAAALVCAGLTAQPAAAQQRDRDVVIERRECRCMDGQGREIERCVCVGGPDGFAFGPRGGGPWQLPVGPMAIARRAVLGVGISTEQADEFDAQGARVGEVEPESGAAAAGIEEGDVIVRVDGRSLLAPLAGDAEADLDEQQSLPVQRLLALLADREPGDQVEIEYLRGPAGARRTATVELRSPRPFFAGRGVRVGGDLLELWNARAGCPSPAGGARGVPAIEWGRSCAAGAQLIELNAGLAAYFQADAGDVLVTDVAADGPLALEPGDVIVAVGGREVRGLEHALGVLRSYQADERVQVRVIRKGRTVELDGTLR